MSCSESWWTRSWWLSRSPRCAYAPRSPARRTHPGGDQTFLDYEARWKGRGGADGEWETAGHFVGGTGRFAGITGTWRERGTSTLTTDTGEWEAQYETLFCAVRPRYDRATFPDISRGEDGPMNIAHVLARKGVRVITIRPEQSIRLALALLAEHNIGALVAVDESARPVGILSERDVVRYAARDEHVFGRAVSELMTRDVVVGVPEDDLKAVGRTMTERHIRHLPVVEKGKLVGIVSIGDVVNAQRDEYEGELDTLQTQISEGGH